MDKYCFEFKKEPVPLPDKISKLFMKYNWPGNVRELENVVRRAIALRNWEFVFDEFSLENLGQDAEDGSRPHPHAVRAAWSDEKIKEFFRDPHFSLKGISKAYVSEAEQTAILDALRETHWNRKKAAKLLNVSYKTLLNRILEFDLEP
jgi:two-component system response regulator AtoC